MKEYTIIYKFSDVIQTITAETKEEATEKANKLLEDENTDPIGNTDCYEVEVEEVE
jgi:hypothetical protein